MLSGDARDARQASYQNANSNSSDQTGSAFDYLYDTLLDNDLNKMCKIMRKPEAEQIMQTLGKR